MTRGVTPSLDWEKLIEAKNEEAKTPQRHAVMRSRSASRELRGTTHEQAVQAVQAVL